MRTRVIIVVAAAATLAGCASAAAAGRLVARSAPARAPSAHTATLPPDGQHRASLAVLTGAASVTVSAAAMPGRLLRAWTPAGSGIRPELVEVNGAVQLYLGSTGQGGPDAVWIQLSSAVRWRLQFSGGSSQTVINMGNGALSGVDFTAGSSLIAMTLPRPAGTVPITLAGGASQVDMTVPAGVPARLQLYGGASTANLGGRTYTGIAGGTVLTAPGWPTATSRYDVAAPAGVSMISVTG
jgi:hypothetical protein